MPIACNPYEGFFEICFSTSSFSSGIKPTFESFPLKARASFPGSAVGRMQDPSESFVQLISRKGSSHWSFSYRMESKTSAAVQSTHGAAEDRNSRSADEACRKQ